MTLLESGLLIGAAALGGALNAVAGGGSFFTFPALIFVGVPPVPANATSALALLPGSVASAAAYRRDLGGERPRVLLFGLASFAGGTLGALLLVGTPPSAFDAALPLLMLTATVLFAAGPKLTAAVRSRRTASGAQSSARPTWMGGVIQFVISIYGGYFGGGMGMMMLAAFSLLGMEDLHRMNGLKAVLAVVLNAVALGTFAAAGVIEWREGLVMTGGAIAGGYGGAMIAKRLDPRWVRTFVTLSGTVMTVVFFLRALA